MAQRVAGMELRLEASRDASSARTRSVEAALREKNAALAELRRSLADKEQELKLLPATLAKQHAGSAQACRYCPLHLHLSLCPRR